MKSVLISIQPKWCELIASGKKTVEVRKTKPKLETPFKCYIYETKDAHFEHIGVHYADGQDFIHHIGKVIGEFVCDKIFTLRYCCGSYRCEGLTRKENDRIASASKLSLYDMRNYLSCNGGYAWHISNLVIYDKPKELSEFWTIKCTNKKVGCSQCYIKPNCITTITRPPQSFFYVEEVRNG